MLRLTNAVGSGEMEVEGKRGGPRAMIWGRGPSEAVCSETGVPLSPGYKEGISGECLTSCCRGSFVERSGEKGCRRSAWRPASAVFSDARGPCFGWCGLNPVSLMGNYEEFGFFILIAMESQQQILSRVWEEVD